MFFTPSLNIGGIERVFITYANKLCSKYDVTYVCTHKNGNLTTLLDSKIFFHSLDKKRLRQSLFALTKYLIKESPDILITGGNIANCLCLFAIILSRRNIKLIMSHHNYFNVEQNNLLSKWLIKLFYNKANSIISVSHGITDFLIRQGINPHKICTIYNPIDIESIKIKSTNISSHIIPTNNYIVSIGRLNKVKNIILMIDAYMIFHQKHPDVKLVIVGDGEERDNIIKHIEAHQIQSHVLLVGSTDNPYPYIYNSKLVLSTSLSEALPTVFLESLALGKTIVSTPTLGAIDILKKEQYGYLSSSLTEVEAFSNKITKAYNTPKSVDILQKEASTYSIDKKIKELENLFQSILNN